MSAARKVICSRCGNSVRVYVPKGDAADRYVIANHRDNTGDYCSAGRAPVYVTGAPR